MLMATTVQCPDKEKSVWVMFDRTVVMKDQRSVPVFLLDLPSHLRGRGFPSATDPGECVSKYNQHLSESSSFPAHVLNPKAV